MVSEKEGFEESNKEKLSKREAKILLWCLEPENFEEFKLEVSTLSKGELDSIIDKLGVLLG